MPTPQMQTANSPSAYLVDVRPEHVDLIWPEVFPYIERVMARSRLRTPQDAYKLLKEKRATLWLLYVGEKYEAICVTQILDGAHGPVCYLWLVSGKNRKNWLHLLHEMESYAAREGCWLVRGDPRPGLAREMKKYGYRMTNIVVEKVI